MEGNALSRFRLVAFMEGCSFLLFAITMPLKYVMGYPKPNYVVGMIHGVLFMLYIILLIQVSVRYKWNFKKMFLAFLASLLPFGTFIADKYLFRPAIR
ncbi:MAG: DUF3817 domain-containing protein [Ferruginibacter sp.]|nr:DUF3817 domain-containing protein [Ferruginibacter sp.]